MEEKDLPEEKEDMAEFIKRNWPALQRRFQVRLEHDRLRGKKSEAIREDEQKNITGEAEKTE